MGLPVSPKININPENVSDLLLLQVLGAHRTNLSTTRASFREVNPRVSVKVTDVTPGIPLPPLSVTTLAVTNPSEALVKVNRLNEDSLTTSGGRRASID